MLKNFLQDIGILPYDYEKQGYRPPLGYSKTAIEWLDKQAKKNKVFIQHAENGGEVSIRGASGRRYRVDGFCAKTNTIYEFHGDSYHGNLNKYNKKDRPNRYSNKTAKQLYKDTKEREIDLHAAGYNVVVVWYKDYNVGKMSSYEYKLGWLRL